MTPSVRPCECRLEEASRLLDAELRRRGRMPLSSEAYASLHSRSAYPRLLDSLAQVCGIDVGPARALLAQWHEWNTIRGNP